MDFATSVCMDLFWNDLLREIDKLLGAGHAKRVR
jgi:hypothetical protein